MHRRLKPWFLVTLLAGFGAAVVAWIRRGESDQVETYRANERARVFHRSGCRFYGSAGSTSEFTRRSDAIDAGFSPCKVCGP